MKSKGDPAVHHIAGFVIEGGVRLVDGEFLC